MDLLYTSNKRILESNLELCRARFLGKICILIVCIAQFLPRALSISSAPKLGEVEILSLISMGFLALIVILISADYFFYKKLGPEITKHANLVDIALLTLYTADWVLILICCLRTINHTTPPTFAITAFYGFTMFSWRTLLVTLIVQKWWLKIIPPLIATVVAGVYGIIYTPNILFNNIVRSGFQLFNIIIIMYCEDKIKWRMIWTNLQQEKWMQVNDFILNNIPENIMILDFKGEVKFISDYCKGFMKRNNLSVENTEDLWKKIRDLEEQYEPDICYSAMTLQMERYTSRNELLQDTSENNVSPRKTEALEELITNFKGIIEEKNLQERQFLVYNGKLRSENNQQPERSIEIKISFVHNVENEYVILILRDTTQRDLLLKLQETDRYKDQLLASVSHELRAPLNGNINFVESAVNSQGISQDIKENLLIPALRSGKFLLHIINDILDMSQIKQKKLRLVFESKDLKETLKSAVQLVELQAQKKRIELVMELDPQLPKQFCTDHMRLSQIVLNLLSNAMRFTNQGMVKLTAKCLPESPSVKIIVEDSGVGISRGNLTLKEAGVLLNKIFSSYTTIEYEEKQTINSARVGLGLNIASNLASMLAPKGHPGIDVSSVPNHGSIFSFVLENKRLASTQIEKPEDQNKSSCSHDEIAEEIPRNSAGKIQKTSTSIPVSPIKSKNELSKEACVCPKVLIVDDNPFNTMAFETILKSLEIKCDSVYSGSACLEKLLDRKNKSCGKNCRPYSVIFMDQEMPEMTGSETVTEIKRLENENLVPHMKIIGCTAHKAKVEVDNFMESGLDSCIFKPISVGMIRDVLKEIL